MKKRNPICHGNAFLAGVLVFIFAVSSSVASASAPAQRYVDISAEVDLISVLWNGTNGPVKEEHLLLPLTCTVGTNQWRIDIATTDAEEKWHFDGTNNYESIQITKMPTNDARVPRVKSGPVFGGGSLSNATIYIRASKDGHPLGDPRVNIPWLAFCSGTFLRREGRIIPLPNVIISHAYDAFGYSDKAKTFGDELGLPQTIDLYTSKKLLVASITNDYFRGDRNTNAWKSKLLKIQDDVLKFHYEVNESTNFLGWRFPTKFEFVQNDLDSIGPHYSYRGVGRALSFRLSEEPKNLFATDLKKTIVDRRFRNDAKKVQSITYRSTNAFVLQTNDSDLQERFASMAARVRRAKMIGPMSKALPFMAFLFLSLSPIALLILQKLKLKKEN